MASDMQRIKCGLLNVQSARNKTFEIREIINSQQLDFYAITETWLTDFDSAVMKEMTPVTHSFLHNSRRDGRGGGVGLFVSNAMKKVKKCEPPSYNSFELLQVECDTNGNKLTIITVYRPPSTSLSLFIEEFGLYLETIDMVSMNIIVWGDFNLWLDDPEARYVQHFIDMISVFNLANVVDRPTSICGHIIDLVLIDRSGELVRELHVDDLCSLSPVHKFVSFSISLKLNRKQFKQINFRSTRNLNCDTLLKQMCDRIMERYGELCNHGSVIECHLCLYSIYNAVMKEEYENMCPAVEKRIEVKDNAPWYNEEIRRAKTIKKRKERLWRRHRTEERRVEFTRARNYVKRLIEIRKRNFYKERTEQAGPNIHKLYKILDDLTGNKKKQKLPEGYVDSELANEFLQFFENKIRRIVSAFSRSDSVVSGNEHISEPEVKLTVFQTVTESTVKDVITRAKYTHCANDPMPISIFDGNVNFGRLITIMTKMVNASISEGVFPNSEKQAIIKPILKGDLDPQLLSSFRPVSNLTFQSKVLESVLLIQLTDHLNKVGAIHDNQSAYRNLYSTETALCTVVSDMRVLMDGGECGLLLLLDLSAAFDTVVHDTLLEICEHNGIERSALSYLKSYLEGRTYCVQIGDEFSDSLPLRRGVPQGSVLGPVLFCLYTADLSVVLERYGVKFKLYADDTQFYLSVTNIQEAEAHLGAILEDIRQWMESRQLRLNEDKTECLFVGREIDYGRLGVQSLTVNNIDIPMSKCVKNLGVLLDSELMMRDQIKHIVQVAGYHLKNLAFVRKYLDENIMKKLVHNHVMSKLDYCNSIYYGLPNYLLKKLQLIMNRAARLIKGRSRRERITPALIQLHWLPIKARIIYKQCVMVYQALKYGKPNYICDMLVSFRVDTDIALRHSTEVDRLLEPRFHREAGRRAFMNSAPRLYNGLPANIKTSENISIFKRRLKTHLFTVSYDLRSETITPEFQL